MKSVDPVAGVVFSDSLSAAKAVAEHGEPEAEGPPVMPFIDESTAPVDAPKGEG